MAADDVAEPEFLPGLDVSGGKVVPNILWETFPTQQWLMKPGTNQLWMGSTEREALAASTHCSNRPSLTTTSSPDRSEDMLKLLFHCWILDYFYPIVGFLYEKNTIHYLQDELRWNRYSSLQLVAQTQLHRLPQRTALEQLGRSRTSNFSSWSPAESCPRAESLPTRRVALHEAIVRQACESARFIRLSTPSTSAAASPITGRRHLSPPGTQEQNRSLHSQGSDGSFNSVVSASLVFGLDSAQSFALANHEPGTCIAAVSQRDQVPRP
ncbi:hypothetical protein SELMODRAFT_411784 [Selaginella moellendorffii]|uniref:Uncharacterized protein n=1 Tax=Selaginella moellendorffii TaxID=88036 RepID=D8RJ12_SELML|nr:hypothetical protein SELMODRAFT_411784 [Selaginella moellendorffii]